MIKTRTFVCTVGNGANPVVKQTIKKYGFVERRSKGRGVGVFEADLTLAHTNKPGYRAVSDCAGVPDPHGEDLCPARHDRRRRR
ncbi:MAG: hypothetical protein A2138_14060 [Deltaproteobacteria bacterium RBG_16_71_12]|nr:MAG: hypothetical protein A2138_14060 [Deltaproteobacteria bacterium RBG_16_71_12]